MSTLVLILFFCLSIYGIAMFSISIDITDPKAFIQVVILSFFIGCVVVFVMLLR